MFVKDGRRGSWLSRGWSLFWLVWFDAVIMVDRYSDWSRWGLVVIVVNGWSSLWLVVAAIGCCIQGFLYGYGGQWSCWFVVVQFRGGSDGRDYKVET